MFIAQPVRPKYETGIYSKLLCDLPEPEKIVLYCILFEIEGFEDNMFRRIQGENYVWIVFFYFKTITDRRKRVAPLFVFKYCKLLENLERNFLTRGRKRWVKLKMSRRTPPLELPHFKGQRN